MKSKPHIAFLSTFSDLGGAEQSLLTTLAGLKKHGLTLTIICNKPGKLPKIASTLGIPIIYSENLIHFRLKRFWELFFWVSNIISFKKTLSKLNPDIIHCNNEYAAQIGLPAAKLAKTPCIIHHRSQYLSPISKMVLKIFKANYHIVISNFVKKYRNFINHGYSIVYNAIKINKLPHKKTKAFTILLLGRLDPLKGHLRLIEAIRNLSEPIQIIFSGDSKINRWGNKYAIKCQKTLNRYHLETKIIFSGFTNNIAKTLSAVDLLVVPSKNEGFGRVIVEAMACGVPVIADNSGGIPEIITNNHNGILINTSDSKLFANKIKLLMQDKKLYKKLTQNGLKRAADFTIEKHLAQITKIYQEILHEHRH